MFFRRLFRKPPPPRSYATPERSEAFHAFLVSFFPRNWDEAREGRDERVMSEDAAEREAVIAGVLDAIAKEKLRSDA
jgi:hypothetical protein